jgi:hypothetical protein
MAGITGNADEASACFDQRLAAVLDQAGLA